MSNTDVTINTGGYNITQADIDAVTNPFLDLGEALDKGKFYFLEGQYDQIVLEQIFNILYGTNANVLAAVDKQKGVVNAAETAYNDMAAKVAALREIGAYDMATLITSLKNTYAVNGTIPSRNGISCTSAINVPYTDLLSIVCDLCGEAVGDINLRAPSFSGEADLSTLKSQLESYVIGQLESYATDQLESYVTDLKTSLESKLTDYLADYETQLRANIPLDDLKTALEGVVAGLDDGTKKNDINAAIAAITTYSTGTVDEETTNWDALKTALNAVKDYVEISDITPSTASVIAVIDAMDKITTYNANKTDANLNDVKTALDTIKDYAEISDNISSTANVIAVIDAMDKIATYAANKTDANWEAIKAMLEDENLSAILGITSPSIANVTAVIDAMDKIATYAANKTDANWEAIKAMLEDKNLSAILGITSPSAANITTVIDAIDKITTYAANKTDAALETVKKALEAIDGLSGISTQISIPSMIGNISTYFNVKTAIEQAKRAIDTLKGSKTKANLDDVFSKLSAVNTALEQIPTTLRTSYYDANLKAEIDAAISKTSTIRSKLGGLIDAIDAYKGASTLMESLDFFQEITIAFNAFSDGTMQADFGNSKVPDLSNRINSCATNLNNVFSTFGKFYEDLDTLITTCQNPTVKDLLDSNQQKTYYDGNSLKSNLTYAQFVALCDALSNSLNGLSNAVTTAESSLNAAQKTLGDITPANTTATICDLLNLCMMASTPKPQANGTYRLVTGIQRTIDANGNYTYALKYGGSTITQAQYDASFSKKDGYVHYSLPYFALAIMYEKVGIQQMILVEQLKQVEAINEAIEKNNTALKALSLIYERAYARFTTKGTATWEVIIPSGELQHITGMSMTDLNNYLAMIGVPWSPGTFDPNPSHFSCAVRQYNKDGDVPGVTSSSGKSSSTTSTETQNIDVQEQATLTTLSNRQDAVRIYGDKLSTDSQLMTTKMSQYMQNSNACVSACTQVVKSIGEYFKTNISNIR